MQIIIVGGYSMEVFILNAWRPKNYHHFFDEEKNYHH
jgi:hypothetical protein